MEFSNIETTSPLYNYWKSSQDDVAEEQRLLKANTNSPAASLFIKEPYKWEVLYQSIVRELMKGDVSSIKGLKLLLDTINLQEKQKTIKHFAEQGVFSNEIIEILNQKNEARDSTKKNLFRFLRILFAIFTNPYNIEYKRDKQHIYEHTGAAINSLKNVFK